MMEMVEMGKGLFLGCILRLAMEANPSRVPPLNSRQLRDLLRKLAPCTIIPPSAPVPGLGR